jgi:GTP-binding protein HflX
VPEVIVWNKADAADPDVLAHLRSSVPGSVVVSARTGEGVDELLRVVGDRLRALTEVVELRIPWADGGVLAAVHREGEVLLEVPGDDAMTVRARLEPAAASRFRAYLADEVVT